MTDCTCHAGKICGTCEVEVMGNLNKYAMSTNIEYPESHVKMEGKKIGKIVGKFIKACIGGDSMCPCQDGDPCHYEGVDAMKIPYNPEKIERDILDELSMLRQKVADMETAKAFHVSIYENIIERLKDAEDHVRIMNRVLGGLELQRLRGNG